jgi:hypothetical protein
MNIVVIQEPPEPVDRPVYLSNEEWLILSQCVEAFTNTYRSQHSQVIATYLTRGQVDVALSEAANMNNLLQRLDQIQAKLFS